MDSIIEVQRHTHEGIEQFERALYTILSKPQPTHESRLQVEHKTSQLLDRLSSRLVSLKNLYEDQDTRKAEVDSLSAHPHQNDLSTFYSRVGKIQEHYAKYPDAIVSGLDPELAAFLEEEEAGGGDEEYEEDDRMLYSAHRLLSSSPPTSCSCRTTLLWRRGLWEVS